MVLKRDLHMACRRWVIGVKNRLESLSSEYGMESAFATMPFLVMKNTSTFISLSSLDDALPPRSVILLPIGRSHRGQRYPPYMEAVPGAQSYTSYWSNGSAVIWKRNQTLQAAGMSEVIPDGGGGDG
ncbi:hypothetical protein AAHC03_024395 [Spirometra sp. Aus1]